MKKETVEYFCDLCEKKVWGERALINLVLPYKPHVQYDNMKIKGYDVCEDCYRHIFVAVKEVDKEYKNRWTM